MKTRFVYFLIIIIASVAAAQIPEKVYRITQEYYSNDWYKKQSDLWKKVIEKDPQNAAAWESYYYANRYVHFDDVEQEERQARLAKIIEDMGKAIPDSYEYQLLKAWNNCPNIMDISDFEKAYQMNPDRPDPLYTMVAHYEVKDNRAKVKELYQKIYDSRDIVPELLEYNYNVLMSVEKNGILYTNGDNDTYPARMLQVVKNVRPDVTIINASLAGIDDYLKAKLSEKNIDLDVRAMRKAVKNERGAYDHPEFLLRLFKAIDENYADIPQYFALTMSAYYTGAIEDELLITGLANRYCTSPFDNMALLQKNIEKHFRLDYLQQQWYRENYVGKNMIGRINANYAAAFLKLANHYKLAGDSIKSGEMRALALHIAKTSGDDELVQYISEQVN